jgi:hypothetical protein
MDEMMDMTWKKLAPYKKVYYDARSGLIFGIVLTNVSDGTAMAFYNDKSIGDFISEDKAKNAVENRHAAELLEPPL